MLQEAELSCEADSENNLGGSSETMYYIGLDVHKKTISYCVKDAAGKVYQEGKIGSTRRELDSWIKTLPQPRTIAMEATIFTGWIYDHLLPHAEKVKVAHPLMLRAIAAAKRKNDKIDASKIADCLRCDFLPECHMASTEIRDRRRTLRYRGLLVKQMVQMKNRVSGLLLEKGVTHTKRRLHKVGYFAELMAGNEEIDQSIRPLLKLSREHIVRAQKLDYALISSLERDPLLQERLKRLQDCSRSRSDHGADLGSGDRRCLLASSRSSRRSVIADYAEPRRARPTRCCARRFPSSATSTFSMCWWRPRSWRPGSATNWL